MRAYELSIFCQMDRCSVVLENRMARSLEWSGKDLVTAMLLSEGAWDVLFSKNLVSLSGIIAGVLTFSDGAAGAFFGDGSAVGDSCGACRFASLSDAARSASGSLEVCFATDRVIGAMAARRIQHVLLFVSLR